VWFSYFLIKHKLFYLTIIAALLFVARPNGLFMGLILLVSLYKGIQRRKISWVKVFLYCCLSILPFAGWCFYSYLLTGNSVYWHEVQSVWFKSPSILHTFGQNFVSIFSFFDYPIHGTRESKLDVLSVIVVLGLIIWSRKFFHKYPQLWWVSLFIWLTPLLVKDLMSYSRYQIISFPIFIFLAARVTGWKFYALSALFLILLFYTSLHLVNWQWVG
jgi:hypothetical protein